MVLRHSDVTAQCCYGTVVLAVVLVVVVVLAAVVVLIPSILVGTGVVLAGGMLHACHCSHGPTLSCHVYF